MGDMAEIGTPRTDAAISPTDVDRPVAESTPLRQFVKIWGRPR